MKTRNNDSTHDETLLNQSITRRSFVKRGAVASAATVFGISTSSLWASGGGNPSNDKVWRKDVEVKNNIPLSWASEPDSAVLKAAIIAALETATVKETHYCYSMNTQGHPSYQNPGDSLKPVLNHTNNMYELTIPKGTGYQVQYGSPVTILP